MVTLKNGNQILPNWTLYFEEISNNVYHVELKDNFGRLASTTDDNLNQAIKTCEGYAFGIERQVSGNWSRFLFEYSLLKLQDKVTFSNGDSKNAYGSWGINTKDKTLVYDGSDNVLVAKAINADAFDYKAISLNDLFFDSFNEYIDFVRQETQPTT